MTTAGADRDTPGSKIRHVLVPEEVITAQGSALGSEITPAATIGGEALITTAGANRDTPGSEVRHVLVPEEVNPAKGSERHQETTRRDYGPLVRPLANILKHTILS